MQLFKHMEVVLMLAFGLLCVTFAFQPTASVPRATFADLVAPVMVGPANAVAPMPMPVVNVVGRRLTRAEKEAAANAS
jgi:predicted membrane protein